MPRRLPFCVLLALVAASWARGAPAKKTFDVTMYGAKGDAVTDDTAAIQRAINAAEAGGGGNVYFPARTYLLDSYRPSSHPWYFYNLIINSNVMLCGQSGAKLLQGPNGRHTIVAGATEVRNTMLAFGPHYEIIRFQKTAFNGGFSPLNETTANASAATLREARNASHFSPGDYVAIFAQTTGDVIPTETSRVSSVDVSTGVISLQSPLARSFPSPVIANVTSLATVNVGLKNLILQGAEPLAVTETFGFTAENNQFISDTAIGGGNIFTLNLNTLHDFRFVGNTIKSIGPSFVAVELPQRNSQYGLIDANTIEVKQIGMGEFAAHWKFTRNDITLHPDPKTTVALFFGGYDISFSNNAVRGGNLTGGDGFGSLVADYNAPDFYASYVGKIRISDNTFECRADGNSCLGLFAPDTVVTGNTLTVTGSAMGIHAEGPLPQSLTIQNNTLRMGSGNGMVVVSPKRDGSTITGNSISGAASAVGIVIVSPPSPNSGADLISNNTIRGFMTHVSIDLAKHPGTSVSSN